MLREVFAERSRVSAVLGWISHPVPALRRKGQTGASELFFPDTSCLLAGREPPRCHLPASSAARSQHEGHVLRLFGQHLMLLFFA